MGESDYPWPLLLHGSADKGKQKLGLRTTPGLSAELLSGGGGRVGDQKPPPHGLCRSPSDLSKHSWENLYSPTFPPALPILVYMGKQEKG